MVDFVYGRFWCMWPHVCKRLNDIFANLIQMLTSEARVLNPKACGVQGRSPVEGVGGEAPHQFFLAEWIKCLHFFFSEVAIFAWKMRTVLNQMKNKFSDFFDFYFSSYGRFCTQKLVNFQWILSTKSTITRKLKIDKLIFHLIQHCAHPSCKYGHFWSRGDWSVRGTGVPRPLLHLARNEIRVFNYKQQLIIIT